MDPGNRLTGLEGDSRFGYALMWVVVMSGIMAVLLKIWAEWLGLLPHAWDRR